MRLVLFLRMKMQFLLQARHVILLLCQFVNYVEATWLPVYYPSQQEKDDPRLYAENVRRLMAHEVCFGCNFTLMTSSIFIFAEQEHEVNLETCQKYDLLVLCPSPPLQLEEHTSQFIDHFVRMKFHSMLPAHKMWFCRKWIYFSAIWRWQAMSSIELTLKFSLEMLFRKKESFTTHYFCALMFVFLESKSKIS